MKAQYKEALFFYNNNSNSNEMASFNKNKLKQAKVF
jgi:hypothetical protein